MIDRKKKLASTRWDEEWVVTCCVSVAHRSSIAALGSAKHNDSNQPVSCC